MSGDHILSPHIEGAHRVNVSVFLSSGAIAMMVLGVILYCLIKKKLVRCCVKAHLLEQGVINSIAKPAFQNQTQLGLQPSAPAALQFQGNLASSQVDIENSLARLQLQYAALASQLSCQQEQKEQLKNQGAPGSGQGAPRLNQYPLV